MPDAPMTQQPDNCHARPCSTYVGAEITGIDAAAELGGPIVSFIKASLHKYGVVFMRNQTLTESGQVSFSRRFGELEMHVLTQYTSAGHPEILKLSNIIENNLPLGLADAGQHWHSDTSYLKQPDLGSILYAREVPAPHQSGDSAGDTMFASAQAAYDALEPEMQKRLSGLKAVYSYVSYYEGKLKAGSNRAPLTDEQRKKLPDATHPLIRTHPVTARKSIYVNPGHTVRIDGLTPKESQDLLAVLYEHVTQPKFIYRHQWQRGDLLMWDNCVVQHNAVADYALPQRRLMHRTTIKGTVPF